ncbi:MAG: sigma 54-interacting transcriptional regulator [Planctomycetota bacterium]|nr:sigma 54-interacting transcriptional regulator [Planctomycetota bacterium]
MSFALVQLNGSSPGNSLPLDVNSPPVTLGRDPARDFPIDDHMCSRLHCRLWFDGNCWRVEDCASRNGTYLNSRKIDQDILQPGDAIRIGDRLFVFIQQGEVVSGSGWQPALLESTTFVARIPDSEQKDAVIGQLRGKGSPDSIRNAAILCRLAGELHEKDSIESMLRTVVDALKAGTKADAIVIWLTGIDGRLRRYGARPAGTHEAPSPLASLAMDQKEALLVEQPGQADDSMESTVVDQAPGSAICVPIPQRTSCRGAIEVLRNSLTAPLKQSNLELCIAVARQAGLALENLEHRERLEQANVQLRSEVSGANRIIGASPAITRLLELIGRVSPTESTVLVSGESGTGKELVARMIHDSSLRSSGPYVAVNCAAFNEALLESELFGHEKGAFTGAVKQHLGQFERAHRGTIFLDEIGEMSLNCQAKLLRILEGHSFERLGGTDRIQSDVRIIAATHRTLPDQITDGRFRDDLYFRLRVIELQIPPLRDRGDDILLLAGNFLQHFHRKTGRGPIRLSSAAGNALMQHSWPGNVRELRNAIERAAVLGFEQEVQPDDLGLRLSTSPIASSPTQSPAPATIAPQPPQAPDTNLADAELRHIKAVLAQCGGNKSQACKLLGIGRGTLYKKLNEIEDRSL